MIKLLKLNFVGIGRFTKKQEISFENREKLIQVDGKNLNTGGSSGAGKSTMFHALDYLLGINKTPATALQSRIGKVGLEVEGFFDIDGKQVRIVRSKKDGLSLFIDDESITGNVKLAEERLEDLIGIPKELFKKMVHKKQKQGGFFLNLTAKESFEFLIKVLGLEHYTKKIEKIEKHIKSISELNEKNKLNKSQLEVTNKSLKDTLDSLKKPELSFDPKEIIFLKEEIGNLNKEIEQIHDSKKKEIDSIEKPILATVELDMSGIVALKTNLSALDNKKLDIQRKQRESRELINQSINSKNIELNRIENAKKEVIDVSNKIKELKAQKEHIESSKCPTCSQTWVGDSAFNQIKNINLKLVELAEKAWGLKTNIDNEPAVIKEINDLKVSSHQLEQDGSLRDIEEEIAQLRSRISEEQAKINNYQTDVENKQKIAQMSYQNTISEINNKFFQLEEVVKEKIRKMNSVLTQKNFEIESYEKQNKAHQDNVKNLTDSIQSNEFKLNDFDKKTLEYDKNIKIAEEAKKAIRNYTLQIFQESLDYIGEQASQIMSKIPNMSNCSIYFEGCKETAKGAIKDEVNAILNMDGENEINIKTLSGGEETAVELAVDLAVIEMIEHKTGKGADFFILDEPFDGLDSICKEQCLDLLQGLDTNKKIIMVDHSTELKAMVNEVITVVREGEESNIIS